MERLLPLTVTIAALAGIAPAHSQEFPAGRPMSLVVPFAAGGSTDWVARDQTEAMRKHLGGASVRAGNTAGAGGTIGANKVAKATPDCYTLLL